MMRMEATTGRPCVDHIMHAPGSSYRSTRLLAAGSPMFCNTTAVNCCTSVIPVSESCCNRQTNARNTTTTSKCQHRQGAASLPQTQPICRLMYRNRPKGAGRGGAECCDWTRRALMLPECHRLQRRTLWPRSGRESSQTPCRY
jgi:hypothetical protein